MQRHNPFVPGPRRYNTAPKPGGCALLLAGLAEALLGALAAMSAVAEGNTSHPRPSSPPLSPAPTPTPTVEFRETYPPLPAPDQPVPGLLI